MQDSYEAGLSTGSKNNQLKQVKLYMTFMIMCGFSVFYPDLLSILLYAQFLNNSFKSVQSIRNYMSGVKIFLSDRDYPVANFQNSAVKKLVKGFERLSSHVPQRAPALSTKTIKRVCDILVQFSLEGFVAASAILFGTCSFLRQSNFLSTQWLNESPHIINRNQLSVQKDVMWISVMSTKTLSKDKAVSIPIPRIKGSNYCPVKACIKAMQLVPGPDNGPVFLSPYTKGPMSASRVTALLRLALQMMGHPAAATATVHSTRRSGAQIAARSGASQDEVELHGTWASHASEVYAPKKLYSNIPSIMSKQLY